MFLMLPLISLTICTIYTMLSYYKKLKYIPTFMNRMICKNCEISKVIRINYKCYYVGKLHCDNYIRSDLCTMYMYCTSCH